MNTREFYKMLKGTRFEARADNSAALKAARLHFVDGETNISVCAQRAGCTRQAARAAIVRIRELIENQDLVSVTVMVPKGNKGAVERFAASLRKDAR